MTFERRLKEERERLGMTQAEFAELGGVKRVSQHLYEQGDRHPDVEYLEALMKHQVDVQYLILGHRATRFGPTQRLDFTPKLLSDIFRVVDEFARDDYGEPLPLEERLRLFQFLAAALSGSRSEHDASELRAKLASLSR